MTLKISTKYHNPQELYAFLTKNLGKLSILIRRGYAYITFHKKIHEDQAIKKYQGTQFLRKRLFFKRVSVENGNEIENEDWEVPEGKDFLPKNVVQQKIYQKKLKLRKKMENMFEKSLQICGDRYKRIFGEFKNATHREKQLQSFVTTLEQKLEGIQNNFVKNMQKLFQSVNYFAQTEKMQPQPIFKEYFSFSFPEISITQPHLQCTNEFKSSEAYPVKRLCPLNSQQFLVSSSLRKGELYHGSIRFYDSGNEDFRENLTAMDGAYGINIANGIVFAGTYNSSLNFINLAEKQLKVENSGILQGFPKQNSLIYEIKVLPELNDIFLSLLSMDQAVRIYNVTYDEIAAGIFSFSFEKSWEHKCDQRTLAIEVVNQTEMLIGSYMKIKKVNIEKNRVQEINTSGDIWKIKKFSKSYPLIACTASKTIEIADLRTNSIVQRFPSLDKEIKCFETVPDHTVVYGANKEIGMFDDRKNSTILWSDSAFHLGPIVDIIRLEDKIISGDMKGGIYSWESRKM